MRAPDNPRVATPAGAACLGLYALLFFVLALPWIRSAQHAIPAGGFVVPGDQRLLVWALAWVAHALVGGGRIFDANIFYPAPGQLTGSEACFSSQIVFAPIFLITGNAVLAANALVIVSYPLAAWLMARLVGTLGCAPGPAWIAGLVFALGPLRVPPSVQLLQYANLYLPLVVVALSHVWTSPGWRSALGLATAVMLALFSSYYMAVMTGVTALLWLVVQPHRSPRRGRALLLAAAAGSASLLALLVVSRPYFSRMVDFGTPEMADSMLQMQGAFRRLLINRTPGWVGAVPLALALAGVLATLAPSVPARRSARAGLAFSVAAAVLMLGPVQTVGSVAIPLPFALLTHSPAAFFRAPWRFAVVLGFGIALLAAGALEAAVGGASRWTRRLLLAAVFVLVIITKGAGLARFASDEIPAVGHDRRIYEEVREVTLAMGRGPLLELPVSPQWGQLPEITVADMMMGATIHWLPLVLGYTGYWPAHTPLLRQSLQRLPSDEALQDLIDLTHLRWLLLEPPRKWRDPSQHDVLLRSPLLEPVLVRDGWVLARVVGTPAQDALFRQIAEGRFRGSSP